MLLTRVVPLLAFTLSASARSSFFGGNTQQTLNADKLQVPGENPLKFCDAPYDYILDIRQVDLTPNPPEAGTSLSIKASGILKERVEEGAYVILQVKYGVITLIKQTVDLCEQVSEVDLDCPLEEGPLTMVKKVDLPKQIPPGKYTVLADVYSNKDESITCLTAEVQFARS